MKITLVHRYGEERVVVVDEKKSSAAYGAIAVSWPMCGTLLFSARTGWGLDKDVRDWRIAYFEAERLGLKPFTDPQQKIVREHLYSPTLNSAQKRTGLLFGDSE